MSKIEIQIIVEVALNGIKTGLEDYYNWSDQLPIFIPEYIIKAHIGDKLYDAGCSFIIEASLGDF